MGRCHSSTSPRAWKATTLLVLTALATPGAHAQQAFCLPDAPRHDGHPLFGNPEAMLNAFASQQGLTARLTTHGAVGDLDGDGDLDAVSMQCWYRPADNPATQLSILLNRGDATFVNTAVYPPGDYPTSVAIGDVNGDSLNDLAVTNGFSNQVSVMINAGGGAFPTRVGYAVGQRPRSVVIADLDGDGDLDLAVANAQSNTVSVLLNNGQGTFAPAVTYASPAIPDSTSLLGDPFAFGGPYLAAGDVDGDGYLDLAVPRTNGASLLRNNGNGTFAPYVSYVTGLEAWAVTLADVTGDGHPDLLTANPEGNSISVLANSGGGTFAPAVTHSIIWAADTAAYQPITVALADLDQDGDLDVAVGRAGAYEDTPVLMNAGDGSFGPLVLYHTNECAGIVSLADLNGDGNTDLAAFVLDFVSSGQKLCVLLNDGTGTLITDQRNRNVYTEPPGIWFNPYQLEFVDWDGDSDLDVVALNHGSSVANVAIQLNDGAGHFSDPVAYLLPGNRTYSMVVADLDNDGDLDVIATGPESAMPFAPGRATVLVHNTDGTLTVMPSFPTNSTYAGYCVGSDVDLDGDTDIVISSLISPEISVLRNNGDATFAAPLVQSFPPGFAKYIAAADLNGDGAPDLVMRRFIAVANENLQVLWGAGDGTFAPGPIYVASPHLGRVALADLDTDGDPDVIATSNGTYEPVTFSVLLNDGTGALGPAEPYWLPGNSAGWALRIADVNQDTRADVAVALGVSIALFFGNGDGTFAPGVMYGTGSDVESIAIGDLDGDGDVDIGNVNTLDSSEGTYSLLWNRGCGPLRGDLDGDGDIDLPDFALFLGCFSGPGPLVPDCPLAEPMSPDLDHDNHVDLRDAALLFAAFTQP